MEINTTNLSTIEKEKDSKKSYYTREQLQQMETLPDNYIFGNYNTKNFKSGKILIDMLCLKVIAKLISFHLYKFICENKRKELEVVVA